MAFLFWPDAARLTDKGYVSVANVPAIFSSDWKYHDELSRYLRERALAEWVPSASSGGRSLRVRRKYLTASSLKTVGNALVNFLEWCERRGRHWSTLDYTEHIVEGYQAQMLSGSWSVEGTALAGATVNQRVNHACHFLTWAGDRQLRTPFSMVTSTLSIRADSGTSVHGHRALEVQARAGSVRQAPASLRLPTDQEVVKWLSSVQIERGSTKVLICAEN